MKSRERRACTRPSDMRNQAGETLSVQYEVVQTESMSTSAWYEELSRRDFVSPLQSRAKGGLSSFIRYEESSQRDFARLVRSHATRKACPHLSSTRNQAGGTSSIWYDVVRMECLSSFIRYEESSWRDFVHSVRSRAIGGLVLVRPVRGIK